MIIDVERVVISH